MLSPRGVGTSLRRTSVSPPVKGGGAVLWLCRALGVNSLENLPASLKFSFLKKEAISYPREGSRSRACPGSPLPPQSHPAGGTESQARGVDGGRGQVPRGLSRELSVGQGARGRTFLPVVAPCPGQGWVSVEKLVPGGPVDQGQGPRLLLAGQGEAVWIPSHRASSQQAGAWK